MATYGFWKIAQDDPSHVALIEPDGLKHNAGELLAEANRVVHGLRALGLKLTISIGVASGPRPTAASNARFTTVLVKGTLYAFMDRGAAPVTAAWLASAAVSRPTRLPVMVFSAATLR